MIVGEFPGSGIVFTEKQRRHHVFARVTSVRLGWKNGV